jgi:hypothetical protein
MNPRRVAFFSLVALAACVPPTEELLPAGAAGFRTAPSPAARGEPFTTVDGWTVRFDKLIVQATVEARGGEPSGTPEDYRWNGAAPAEIFVRALPEGPWLVSASLSGLYGVVLSPQGHLVLDPGVDELVVKLGVDERDNARFRAAANNAVHSGPFVLVVARGEKGDRAARFDLALGPPLGTGGLGWHPDGAAPPLVEVRRNTLAWAELPVTPERILDDGFDEIAAADRDGDGIVTAAELAAVETDVSICPGCPPPPPDVPPLPTLTLLDKLARNAQRILPSWPLGEHGGGSR